MQRIGQFKKVIKRAQAKFYLTTLFSFVLLGVSAFGSYTLFKDINRIQSVIGSIDSSIRKQITALSEISRISRELQKPRLNNVVKEFKSELDALVSSLNNEKQLVNELIEEVNRSENVQSDFMLNFSRYLEESETFLKFIREGIVQKSSYQKVLDEESVSRQIEMLTNIISKLNRDIDLLQADLIKSTSRLIIYIIVTLSILMFIIWLFVFRPLFNSFKSMLEDFYQALLQANTANRAKGEFLANVSHEIRTPMTAIVGYADILINEDLSREDIRKNSEIIQTNSNHLLQILNQILDISRLDFEKFELAPKPTDLKSLVEESVLLFGIKAEQKGINLSSHFQSDYGSWFVVDDTRLKQILSNLIGNAIKFTSQGRIDVVAQVEEVSNDSDAEVSHLFSVSVIDTGMGIPRGDFGKVFKAFEQVDSSFSRRAGGTGLGLSLSSKLAERMGGGVELVDSEVGQGSHFKLSVKVKLPGKEVLPELESVQREEGEEGKGLVSLKGCSIIVVDDAKENLRLFSTFLEKAGAQVYSFSSGVEALENIRESDSDFSLLLLDLQMPEMNGFEVLQKLRETRLKYPIVALTAHGMEEDKKEVTKAGFDGHIVKPIGSKDLVMAVDKIIRKFQS